MEKEQKLAIEILKILNQPETQLPTIRKILELIKKHIEFDAVGIRLRAGEDFPYLEQDGFPEEFIKKASRLCVFDAEGTPVIDKNGKPYLECMCGNVISGRTNSKLPFFTKGGSFWTNSTTDLLAKTTEKERQAHTRNHCNASGYESVALIPLRSGDEVIGLLQLNDHKRNRFTLGMIVFYEGLGASIGIALSRKRANEALRESEVEKKVILNGITANVAFVDKDLRIVWVNKAAAASVNKLPEEMVGHTCHEFWANPAAPCENCPTARAFQTKRSEQTIVRTPDGKIWEEKGEPVFDDKGNVVAAVEIAQDITERKQSEEEIQWRTALLEAQIHTTIEGILIVDAKGNKIIQNQRSVELWKLPKHIADNPDDKQQIEFVQSRVKNPEEFAEQIRCLYDHPNETSHDELELKDGMILDRCSAPVVGKDGTYFGRIWIFRDITENKKSGEDLRQSYEKLQKMANGVIQSITRIGEIRDPYTAGHEQRVSKLASAIASELGMKDSLIQGIVVAAILHDIGKIAVPSEILSKPGRINDYEFSMIKTHPLVGYQILKEIEFPGDWPVALCALQHQERMNGSGYPEGLVGEKIVWEARIIAVADVVEAMSSHRPYRPALGIDKALDEIRKNRNVLYDPKVVDACVSVFTDKGFKFTE